LPFLSPEKALRIFALRIFAPSNNVLSMNPFVYGKIVENEAFCPRDALISELGGCFESGQNTVLFGRRRVGKSSLVLAAGKHFPKRLLFRVDLFFTKDTAMFLEYCSNALFSFQNQRKGMFEEILSALKRVRPRIELDSNTGAPSLSFGLSGADPALLLHTVDDFFDYLGNAFGKNQLIVCFDEFQSILEYPEPEALLAKIRSKVQYHPFPYVFTGSDRSGLKTVFTRPKSPFYKSVRPIEVPSIPRKDFQPFLQKKFADGERTVSAEVWNELFSLEIPGDIQQLCAALWENSSAGDSLVKNVLPAAWGQIFAQEIEGFRSLLGELTALQLRVLKQIAKTGTENLYSLDSQQAIGASASSIRRSLTALTAKWILAKDDGAVYFNNPFLRQFLLCTSAFEG